MKRFQSSIEIFAKGKVYCMTSKDFFSPILETDDFIVHIRETDCSCQPLVRRKDIAFLIFKGVPITVGMTEWTA